MLYEGLHKDPITLALRLLQEIDEHRDLLDAIARRGVNGARGATRNHVKIMKGSGRCVRSLQSDDGREETVVGAICVRVRAGLISSNGCWIVWEGHY